MLDIEREQDIERLRTVARLQKSQLEHLIAMLARKCAELEKLKGSDGELQIALKLLEEAQQEAAKLDEPAAPSGAKKKAKGEQRGHGPTERSSLPRVLLRCELGETERECPSCHGTLKSLAGQAERSEMIDVVELKYQVVEVERQKYVCACGGAVETAPGPVRAVDGGRYSLRFAIKVAFDKYVAHLPLERQVSLMAHHGLNVTSQTLWDQCSAVTELLAPTYDALFALLRASPVVGVDQTGWPDLEGHVAAAVADVVRDRAGARLSPDLRRQVGADLQGPAGRLPGLGGRRRAGLARGGRARVPRALLSLVGFAHARKPIRDWRRTRADAPGRSPLLVVAATVGIVAVASR